MTAVTTTHTDVVYQALLVMEATAGLRHDLRNRLASVRNASFYLKRKVESSATELWANDGRVPKFFEMIDGELTSAEEIIVSTTPQVLAGQPAVAEIDVAALASAVIGELDTPSAVTMVAPEPGPVRALADPIELRVGLRCLIENAVDAVLCNRGTIRITCATNDDVARVSVIDNGPGFGEGPRERWLKPFATSKAGRMGLGLNIARRVATRAGGGLLLEDGVERGAAITITLPRAG